MTFTPTYPLNTGQVGDLTAAMTPVVDAIADEINATNAQLMVDTAWVDVTMLTGYTSATAQGHPLQVMRRNGIVFLAGGATGDFPGSVATIPVGFRPGRYTWAPFVSNSSTVGQATINTNGTLAFETTYVHGAGGSALYGFSGSWPV